jgi:hypothetical protein
VSKTKDKKRIQANLKTFCDAKALRFANRGSGNKPKSETPPSGAGIWRPPSASKNGRRTIKGKPYIWHTHNKKWYPDRKTKTAPAAVLPAAIVAVIPPSLATAPTAAAPASGKNQMVQLAMANSNRVVNAAFKNLALQFMDE